ncbi:Cytochrome c oxidase subunit 8, mitochondrial [Pleurotus pulmonarius]
MSAAHLGLRALRSQTASKFALGQAARRYASTGGHGPLPFSYSNRRTFALKYITFMTTGFSIPFIATWWTWNKPGGIHNP